MEIILIIAGIWLIWVLFKGKYQRDQIRESLDDIRIHASKAPFRYMIEQDRSDFFSLWQHFNENEKNEFVGKMIMLGLAQQGLEIKHIPLNIRLNRHFVRTMEDVKESLNHMSRLNG
jgi:hypothetical protein